MVLDAVIFGIIQGIFEWLPISSQGNLVLAMVSVFGYTAETALNYAIFLHIGTVLAAIVYFRKEIIALLRNVPTYKPKSMNENHKVISFLIISTVITGLVGLPVYLFVKSINVPGEIFIALIGLALIFTGVIQRIVRVSGHKNYRGIRWYDGFLLGIAQALSAVPGISRSGITTSTLLFRNYNADKALSLSFLMSIPAVLGAEIGIGIMTGFSFIGWDKLLIGAVFSFVFGLLSIHVLIKVARKIKFWKFCIVLGLISFVPLLGLLL